MVECVEDLHLPNAVVARLIKDALPEGANVSKEARMAITRAASVFVIYLTSASTTLAHQQHHKTITAANIIESLKQLEFENFLQPLEKDLKIYRKILKEKKETKARQDELLARLNEDDGTENKENTIVITEEIADIEVVALN